MARLLIIFMFGLLSCTAMVSSRPVMGPAPGPSNGTALQNAHKVAPRWACCGFLCFGTCAPPAPRPTSTTSTFTCRCSRGCNDLYVTFVLASNQNPGYCTDVNSENYNVGEWCTQRKYVNFNGAFTITSKVGTTISVKGGGWNYKGTGGTMLTCPRG